MAGMRVRRSPPSALGTKTPVARAPGRERSICCAHHSWCARAQGPLRGCLRGARGRPADEILCCVKYQDCSTRTSCSARAAGQAAVRSASSRPLWGTRRHASRTMASAFSKDVKAAREVASEVLASMSSQCEQAGVCAASWSVKLARPAAGPGPARAPCRCRHSRTLPLRAGGGPGRRAAWVSGKGRG